MTNTDTDLNEETLRQNLRGIMEGESISQTEIAGDLDLSSARLSQWLAGKYPGDTAKIARLVSRWIEAHNKIVESSQVLATNPPYFSCPTSEKIKALFDYSQGRGSIGLVTGGAGVCKSTTAIHVSATEANVYHVIATPATSGKGALMQETCRTMDLDVISKKTNILESAIVQKMRTARGLLIIDDAQYLPVDTLYQFAWLREKSRAGVVFMGNEVTHGRIVSGYAQLYSRIGLRLRLKLPLREDLQACLAAWEIQEKLPHQSLTQHIEWFWGTEATTTSGKNQPGPARCNGGLRLVCETIAYAILLSRGAREPVALKHLKAAWKQLSFNN